MFGWLKSKNNSIVEAKTEDILPMKVVNNEELTTSEVRKFTIDECKSWDDTEIIEYLKLYWKIPNESSITVYGKISSQYNKNTNRYFYSLVNVKNLNNGQDLEYPIIDLDKKKRMKTNGVFHSMSSKKLFENNKNQYVSYDLLLSSEQEREKHNNPLMLMVDINTQKILEKIPEIKVIKQDNGNILIEESILNHYIARETDQTQKEIENLERKYNEAKNNLEKNYNDVKNKYEVSIQTKQKEEKKIENNAQKNKVLNDEFLLQIKNKKEEEKSLLSKINTLIKQIETEREMYEKDKKEFDVVIKDKAEQLLHLGFINKEKHDLITGKYTQDEESNVASLDFSKDLNGDFSQAVLHIQAYLYSKNIIYQRSLLEDYFTLLKTNDLIILAGDSGSGKTNLVKKFADAVGGKAKIIPVKPNWTSSDDLLGYYNPLQKTYITTPFLEALLEAKDNPSVPYFICLDEMNLARVEYYFADFLSLLEERGKKQPEISLYSNSESSHNESELYMVLSLIESTKKDLDKENMDSYTDLLKDKEINQELKRVFGFSDKDSLIKYHSELKNMLNGMINTPSSLYFPKNVRIIGTINIDETTHYLSPKILDRAHVIKLNSPSLADWKKIENEVKTLNIEKDEREKIIKFDISDFGERNTYPEFDPNKDFCKDVFELSDNYLQNLGAEISLRSIRQGLNYNQIFTQFNSNQKIAFNNFILHKVLPKFTSFDGNAQINGKEKKVIMKDFGNKVKEIDPKTSRVVINEIDIMLKKSDDNDGIISYWI